MTNELERGGMPARGDGSNIPADGLSRVEISRLDEEQTALRIFRCDPREHFVVDIVGNGFVERRRIREGVAGERGGGDEPFLIDFCGIYIGVNVGQGRIVFGSKEGEGRDECSGAHACYDFELWAIAVSGPTYQ